MDPLPAGDSSHTRPSRRPSCSEATARHRRPQRPHGTWAPLGSPAVRPPCGWKDAFLESIRGGSSSGTKATWAPGRAPTAARPSHVDVPPVGGVSCPRLLPLGLMPLFAGTGRKAPDLLRLCLRVHLCWKLSSPGQDPRLLSTPPGHSALGKHLCSHNCPRGPPRAQSCQKSLISWGTIPGAPARLRAPGRPDGLEPPGWFLVQRGDLKPGAGFFQGIIVLLRTLGFQLRFQNQPEPHWTLPSSSSLTSFSVTQLANPTSSRWTHQTAKTPRPRPHSRDVREDTRRHVQEKRHVLQHLRPRLWAQRAAGRAQGYAVGLSHPRSRDPRSPPSRPARRTALAVPLSHQGWAAGTEGRGLPSRDEPPAFSSNRPTVQCEWGC